MKNTASRPERQETLAVSKVVSIEDRFSAVKQLIELGQDKTYLLHDEIQEMLPDELAGLTEELQEVYARLDRLGIFILRRPDRYQNREEDPVPGVDFDKKDEESQEFLLTEQEKTNDPVRMYLREMGTVPLLDREGEVEIAQRIENGEWMIYEALCSNQIVLRELLRLNETAQKDKKLARELVTTDPADSLDGKSEDRIKKNLATFDRIAKRDREIRSLREKQKAFEGSDPRSMEIEREVDRLLGEIAKDIRSIDFSVQTRNQLVELLRDIHRELSRLKNDIRRAAKALEREKNEELRALQNRRIEKYEAKFEELCKRYGTDYEDVSKTIGKIRKVKPSVNGPKSSSSSRTCVSWCPSPRSTPTAGCSSSTSSRKAISA